MRRRTRRRAAAAILGTALVGGAAFGAALGASAGSAHRHAAGGLAAGPAQLTAARRARSDAAFDEVARAAVAGVAERALSSTASDSPAAAASCRPPVEHLIATRRWLSRVIITEYYPSPERWFSGRLVSAPGLPGLHHVDWLYSARGLSMEGDGLTAGGHLAHIADLGSVGWVNSAGAPTVPPNCGIHWSAGPPDWRAGGWRNRAGAVTYPLDGGGWSDGPGHWAGGYGGATFSLGPSLPLRYYHSVAVDPHLIPEGSRLFIPAYRSVNGGWFVAQDTGGAIIGRHVDVYRPPTAQPFGDGRLLTSARVYVVPPGQ